MWYAAFCGLGPVQCPLVLTPPLQKARLESLTLDEFSTFGLPRFVEWLLPNLPRLSMRKLILVNTVTFERTVWALLTSVHERLELRDKNDVDNGSTAISELRDVWAKLD